MRFYCCGSLCCLILVSVSALSSPYVRADNIYFVFSRLTVCSPFDCLPVPVHCLFVYFSRKKPPWCSD